MLRLVELELIDRERRMVERRIKAAKFPTVKSLDRFDFALVMELARSEYVERRENIIAATSHWDSVWQLARKACQSASPRPLPRARTDRGPRREAPPTAW